MAGAQLAQESCDKWDLATHGKLALHVMSKGYGASYTLDSFFDRR